MSIGEAGKFPFTVTSKAVSGGCEFNFDQEVEVWFLLLRMYW